jgi:diaminopimelate decarboxylase
MTKHPLLDKVLDGSILKNICEEYGTPLYTYYGERIRNNLNSIDAALKNNFDKYQIYYAVKSNNNPNLLTFMHQHLPSLGADCSSPGELLAAERARIPMKNCVYTGNYESVDDLQSAVDSGCEVNLDDESSFKRLKNICIPEYISFRLNPGAGKGRFTEIVTGGHDAKFGIPVEKIAAVYKSALTDGVKSFGLQCHAGSAILDQNHFRDNTGLILKAARNIEDTIDHRLLKISIGSGFGMPYTDDEDPLDFNNVFRLVAKVFKEFYGQHQDDWPVLCIEPGRAIVGDAGILLARVTGIKKSYKNFIGLDAGMETLMRPALYGAFHRIYKVGELSNERKMTVDVTGRICENTDRLAVDIPFPYVDEGDVIAIMDAGAYGYSMAHQFNTRPRPAEVLVDNNKPRLIRSRETIEDIFLKCDT